MTKKKSNKLIALAFFTTFFLFFALAQTIHGSEQKENSSSDLTTKKKTIYIHIGNLKTGSTSIQTFLAQNADLLLENDIFFPFTGRCYSETGEVLNNRGHMVEKKDDEYPPHYCTNGSILNHKILLKQALDRFIKSKKSKMLLSEECLVLVPNQLRNNDSSLNSLFFNREEIWDLLSEYDIKIIVYFRRSVDYLCSIWQQLLRFPGKMDSSLENFLKKDNDYLKNIKDFYDLAKKVGKENVIVRPFEKRAWVNNNLMEDFLSTLNIKKTGKFRTHKNQNIGWSRNRIEKLLYVYKHLGMFGPGSATKDYRPHPVYIKAQHLIPHDKKQEPKIIETISDELIKEVVDRHYPDECKIAKDFLNKEELFQSKYPKIYKQKKPNYKKQISTEDRKQLGLIVNSILQRDIIRNQKQAIDNQNKLIELQTNQNKLIELQTNQNKLIEQQLQQLNKNVSASYSSKIKNSLKSLTPSYLYA